MNSALLQIKAITDDGGYFIAASLDIMLKKHADTMAMHAEFICERYLIRK